jgi:MFS family permease
MPKLVQRFGSQQLALGLAAIEAFMLLSLALNPTAIAAILFAALACAASPLLAYQLDILLEATVKNEQETGRIRTAFLTAGNVALIFAPLIIGLLLDGGERYDRVFFVAFLTLLPFIVLMFGSALPRGAAPASHNVREACRCVAKDHDLRAVAASMFILQVFYHLSPFYIPLYLHTVLGIPWSELGWVFATVLIPFVLIEYPAGVLADKKLGDRTLLLAGFIITGLSFMMVGMITASTSIMLILLILLMTRVGAALVEAMVEGHFFRRVSEKDTNTVSVFRMMRPLGALTAPIIGSLFLAVSTYQMLFVCTGLMIAIIGVLVAIHVRSLKPVLV